MEKWLHLENSIRIYPVLNRLRTANLGQVKAQFMLSITALAGTLASQFRSPRA